MDRSLTIPLLPLLLLLSCTVKEHDTHDSRPGDSDPPDTAADTGQDTEEPGDTSDTSDTGENPGLVFELTGLSIEPDPVDAEATSVLEAVGSFPDGTTFTWQGADGTLAGEGRRVNLTPAAEGSVEVTVTAAWEDQQEHASGSLEVGPPRTRVIIDGLNLQGDEGGGWSLYELTGRVVGLPEGFAAEDVQVAAFVHTDVFYHSAPRGGSPTPQEDGSFSVELRIHDDADRVVAILADAGSDPGADCETCAGVYDTRWRYHVPLEIDGEVLLAFDAWGIPREGTHEDPRITNLLGRFSAANLGSEAEPARLIRSYEDLDQLYTYDQALAVIAFSHAGEREAADTVLRAMAAVQHESGGWYFSYDYDGTSIYPDEGGDRRVSGAIGWMAVALNSYAHSFDGDTHAEMTAAVMEYLAGIRVELEIDGTTHSGVPFGPIDLDTTAWDESAVLSVEHNLDAYAAFRDYAVLTGNDSWADIAVETRALIEVLWHGDHFVPGTTVGVGPNLEEIYLDTQSWGVLALGAEGSEGQDLGRGLDYDCDHFLESAGYIDYRAAGVAGFFDYINGLTLEPPHRFVWTEGSLGMALALDAADDPELCDGLGSADILGWLEALEDARGGLPYARFTVNSDFTTSSSVAGTAWLYFAEQGYNPFQPLAR